MVENQKSDGWGGTEEYLFRPGEEWKFGRDSWCVGLGVNAGAVRGVSHPK